MARHINLNCQACATLSPEQAQRVHGPQGDGCWDFAKPQRCHSKRSRYRHQLDINLRRRGKRAEGKMKAAGDDVMTIAVPIEVPAVAYVYLYRENETAPLHAVGVAVWQGSRKIAEVQTVHCTGKDRMTNRMLRAYLEKVLARLNEKLAARYGTIEFNDVINQPPSLCPLHPCPFKPEFGQLQS